MSDKSKLGFNINPKNYDELNSTDNLITSGSDSGWLGKKLQGDNTSTIDLSNINPLFDKYLYEKYRPGVNTNDGSVNQDIWGYKCFNSPVSFRNGIYGDTYSIKSIEGIEDSIIHKFTYNGVSTSVNDKSHAADKDARDNVRYSYNLTRELLTAQEKSYIASTYTGKLRRALSSAVRPTYDLFEKEPRVYGSSIENETSVSGDVRSDCFWLYTYCNPDNTKLNIYNGINVYSSNSPTQYINERNEINIASTIFNDDNTETAQDTEHTYSESRVTVGTKCKEDIVIKDYTSASGNCIRMYSTNGRYSNTEYINDNISSIIITPDYISISTKNNANQSTDNPYIKIEGTDNSITLHAGKLNLPDNIETTAKFANRASTLSKDADSTNYIYASDNSILPSNDSVISLGDLKTKYNTIYTNKLIATDESTMSNLIIKKNLTYSDFSNHVVKYKLINTSQQGINHGVTQSYKSNYANNELSILYTESFNIGTDHRCNIYKEYGFTHGMCIYGDDDGNGVSDIVIGSTNISILDPSHLRPLYAVHTEIVTSNVLLKRNHSSFKIGTINAIGKSIIITPTYGDIYDIYVFLISAQGFSYTCTNLTGLSQGKNGLILPGTIMLPRLHTTAEDPYYYTRVVVENTVNSDITLQKDEVVFSGFNASQPIAEYGGYYVVLEHRDDLAYEVLETVFIKSGDVYFKCKVKVVDRYAAEKFSAIV